jgi:hypothetical protein
MVHLAHTLKFRYCTVGTWDWTIDISWVDWAYNSSTCAVMYCRPSAAIYIMVVKFRNTICPPPPQLSLHTRAALSSNSNGTRSVYRTQKAVYIVRCLWTGPGPEVLQAACSKFATWQVVYSTAKNGRNYLKLKYHFGWGGCLCPRYVLLITCWAILSTQMLFYVNHKPRHLGLRDSNDQIGTEYSIVNLLCCKELILVYSKHADKLAKLIQ